MLLNKDRRASEISNLRRSSLISLTFGSDLGPFVPEGDFSFPNSNLLANGLGGRNSLHQNLEAAKAEGNTSTPGANATNNSRTGGAESMLGMMEEDGAGHHHLQQSQQQQQQQIQQQPLLQQQPQQHSANNLVYPGGYHDPTHQNLHSGSLIPGTIGSNFVGLGAPGWQPNVSSQGLLNNNMFGGSRASTFSLSGTFLGAGLDESGSNMMDDHQIVNNNLPGLIQMANNQYGNHAIQRLLGAQQDNSADKKAPGRKRKGVAGSTGKKQQKLKAGEPCVTPNAQKLALNNKLQGVKTNKATTMKKGGRRTGSAASKKQKSQAAAATAAGAFGLNRLMPGNLSVSSIIGQALMGSTTTKAVKVDDKKKKKQLGPQKRSREQSSKFRGVSKCSKDGRWQARIRVGKTVKYLGRFKNEEDAAHCYDQAAARLHGKRAQFNFPEQVNAADIADVTSGSTAGGGPTPPPPPPLG